MDWNGVWRFPEGSGRQGRVERYCCNIICGAPTTSEVKGPRWDEIDQVIWKCYLVANSRRHDFVWCGSDHGAKGGLRSLTVARAEDLYIIWATSRENLSSGFATKLDSNRGSSAIETSQSLEISAITSRDITLSRQRKQRRWSVCADAQADLRLCCSHLAKPGVLMTWLIYSDLPHSTYKVFTCGFFISCIVHFCLLSKYLCWMHKASKTLMQLLFGS